MAATEANPQTAKRRRRVIIPRLLFAIAVPGAGLTALAYGLMGHIFAWPALFLCIVLLLTGFKPVYDVVATEPPPGSPGDPKRPLTEKESGKLDREMIEKGPTFG